MASVHRFVGEKAEVTCAAPGAARGQHRLPLQRPGAGRWKGREAWGGERREWVLALPLPALHSPGHSLSIYLKAYFRAGGASPREAGGSRICSLSGPGLVSCVPFSPSRMGQVALSRLPQGPASPNDSEEAVGGSGFLGPSFLSPPPSLRILSFSPSLQTSDFSARI